MKYLFKQLISKEHSGSKDVMMTNISRNITNISANFTVIFLLFQATSSNSLFSNANK